MIIKKFSSEYIKDVAKIEKACFSSPWSEEQLAAELNNKCAKFYVAIENEKAVGYFGLYDVFGEGDISRVAVLPEFRKHGVAKALLNEGFKNNLTSVFLDVRESNIPAINLYISFGFQTIGIRKNYYTNPTENAVIMKKEF